MGRNGDKHIQIAGGAAEGAGLAFTGQSKA